LDVIEDREGFGRWSGTRCRRKQLGHQPNYRHDFVVLETIDLDETDRNFPAPIADPTQISRVLAAADAARQAWEKNRRDVDMDKEMD
jgi:hypothetical protein